MTDSIDFSLIGVDSLLSKFNEISYDVKKKGGRSALRKAAQIVVNKAKEGAEKIDDPNTAKSISSNIAMRWNGRLFKRTGDLGFRVGVLKGAVLPSAGTRPELSEGAPTPEWRLIEFGTEKMRAQPFMRNALADNISEVTDKFLTEYEKSIDRAIKRAKKTST